MRTHESKGHYSNKGELREMINAHLSSKTGNPWYLPFSLRLILVLYLYFSLLLVSFLNLPGNKGERPWNYKIVLNITKKTKYKNNKKESPQTNKQTKNWWKTKLGLFLSRQEEQCLDSLSSILEGKTKLGIFNKIMKSSLRWISIQGLVLDWVTIIK